MTGACPFCDREGVEMVGTGDVQFCRSCAALVDVSAALRHLPDKPEESAARLGRYEIVREVGRGVSGVVYEARDPELGRRVALKVREAGTLGDRPLRRFLREGRLLAKIRHPNVVEVHELGRDQGKVFIVMEFVDGVPFPGTLDSQEGIRRLITVARALDHVHRQGIIHRDLKPSNILVEKGGRPVIMDFGIARSEDTGLSSVTAPGAVLGTPGYMAPEQISSDLGSIDVRTDVFALGVLLFEVLTGKLPFSGASVQDFAERMKSGQTPTPRSLRKDIPAPLANFCRKAISSDKNVRPGSAEEFAQGLVMALAARPSPLSRFALPILAGVLALLVGVGIFAATRETRTPAEPAGSSPKTASAWVEEASSRKARVLGGSASFESALAEVNECEKLYRRALEADPRNAAAQIGLGKLYTDLGRADEAHRAFDRVLSLNPGNLDAVRGKGGLIVTAQLENLFDRKAFPRISRALLDRLGEEQGKFMDDLAKGLPESGAALQWARVFGAVARSQFEEAKRSLSRLPQSEETSRLHYALSALHEQARPAGAPPGRGEEEGAADRSESVSWLALIRHLDHRSQKSRAAMMAMSQRTRIHSGLLRVEALYWELHGERSKAAAALAHATVAAPDYLQAWLLHARLEKELGQKSEEQRDLEAADRLARTMALGAAAREEIHSSP